MDVHPYGMTGRLARFSSRRPLMVVALWVVLFVVALGVTIGYPASFTTDAEFTNQPEALRAEELIIARMAFDGPPSPDEYVVVDSPALTVDDPAFRDFVAALVADVAAMSDYVAFVESYYTLGDERLVADDRRATIVPVGIRNWDLSEEPFLELIDAHDGAQGFTVVTGGEASIDNAFITTSESDLLTGETIGISVAMLVLVLVFGTLVAAGVPLVLAIVAIAVAMGITAIVGHVFELSVFVINMMIMIGLAVGIDYSLFIVGRYREERRRGLASPGAIVRTGDTASKAVLFSGLTVVTALVGMLLVPSTIFKSLGAGAIFVTVVAVAATLTLLPAALSLLGDRVERGRGRTLMAVLGGALLLFAALFSQVGVDTAFIVAYVVLALVAFVLAALGIDPFHRRRTADYREGFWYRVALFVMRHPVPLVTITTALLAGIALIYFTIDLGESGISTLPRDTTAHRAFELISTRFSAISLEEPNQVVVDARDVTTPEVQGAVERLQARLAADAAFGPTSVDVNDAGDLGVLTVPMSDDTRSTVSIEAVQRLRDDYIPAAFAGVDAEALVTGPTAYTVDFNATVDRYTPIVFTFVLSVSFILLMLAFRSVVVPLKSVLMNLLSVGASYGLLVLVFQHGVGNDLLGFQQVERIDAWVPLMMFSILFGLSMDYHVFLLSRIRERFDQTGDNTESVTHGLCSTASIITGAALIMVAVFGGFAMGELTMFQQIGFGLAVAVILDATVIRVILVPATMRLLNTWNWYYPRWLEWLPKLNVEGVPDETPPRPEPATAD